MPRILRRGLAYQNSLNDASLRGACTAVVKRNSKGEVIIGRNQDMEVSEYPAFITRELLRFFEKDEYSIEYQW